MSFSPSVTPAPELTALLNRVIFGDISRSTCLSVRESPEPEALESLEPPELEAHPAANNIRTNDIRRASFCIFVLIDFICFFEGWYRTG
jgi:hypothetical protein